MSIRHLSRSIILQSLFVWDFNKENNLVLEEILDYNIKNFGAGLENEDFIRELAKGVFAKIEEIDKIISKAAPAWPFDQIAIVDRNVLRIGLYELLFVETKEVPSKVAINEAIELAKTFGGETSGKFVNGVLGTVYREFEEVKKEEPKQENLAGAVVYKKEGGDLKFALVHDIFGYWTLPKGKISEGETSEKAAVRKVKEEINIDAEVKEKLGENSYTAYDPAKGKILKNVSYFLTEAKSGEIELGASEGLDGARWFLADDLPKLNIYSDLVSIFTKALSAI